MMLIGAAGALVTDLRCHFESLKMTPQEAPLGDGTASCCSIGLHSPQHLYLT
jgi:hypothetical protein